MANQTPPNKYSRYAQSGSGYKRADNPYVGGEYSPEQGNHPYGQNAYGHGAYGQDASERSAYGHDAHGRNSYDQDAYGHDTYGQDERYPQASGENIDGGFFPSSNDASYYSRDRYGNGAEAGSGRGSGAGRNKRGNEQGSSLPSPTSTMPASTGAAGEASGVHSSYTDAAADASGAHSGNAGNVSPVTVDEVYPEIARVRKRNRKIKRIAAIVGCVIAALLLAGGAYGLWFVTSLDKALAPDENTSSEMEKVLIPEVSGEPFYILVMGSDSREGNSTEHVLQAGDNERSDVIILVRVDAKNKKVTLLSIPRDTAYGLQDGSYVKINEMYNHSGPAGEVKAVSDVTGAPISHHAEVRISGLEKIVDLLGGVTVDVPVELTYETTDHQTVTIEEGKQTLNGQEAQIFARARHEFETDQDQHRQDNVRQLLTAIIDKILERPAPELPGLILQLAEYVDTDMTTMDALSIATAFTGGGMTMYSGTGPSNGDINQAAGEKWLCYLNPEGWKAVMEVVNAGKNPKEADIDYAATEIHWDQVEGQPEFINSLAYQYYYQ